MELRLAPQRAGAEPEPDASQRRALGAIASGNAVITGAPGAGKTTVAVRAIVEASAGLAMERLLLIAPTRQAAAALRDRVSLAVARPTSAPVVRTAASLAFALLTSRATLLGEPRPALISGAEQDVVLRELLEGRRTGRATPLDWGDLPQEATALPGFRQELRNLLMRAAEADLAPEDLAQLGRAAGRPHWRAAAELYAEYEAVMALRSTPQDQGARLDPATIVARAADALAGWEAEPGGPVPSWDLIVVDDFQDATAATAALLDQCAARGARIALIGNADTSVQGYRGAVQGGLAAAVDRLGATHVELEHAHRQPDALGAVAAAVAERIGTKGSGSARLALRYQRAGARQGEDDNAPVVSATAPHPVAEARLIAGELRLARHGDGESEPMPWGQMVVIARSAARLRELRRSLLAADIPCESLSEATALHQEPAVAPLLRLVRAALGEPWTEEDATAVLGSRLIGLDAVGLRRLRRGLLSRERAAGGARSSGELLVEALTTSGALADVQGAESAAAARAARAVSAAAKRLGQQGATPGAVLWAAWEALDLAQRWRDAAIAGSARDDADLDAVIALMRAAQTFTEHLPRAQVRAFLDAVEGQEFAADSLGARASGADAVAFRTPASAAGGEWSLAVIAGLEEGVWPNLALRDTVLGAQRLADALADGLPGAAERATGAVDLRSALASVVDDETRALLVAVSRPTRRLVVTAVDDGETRPSRFLSLIEAAAGVTRGQQEHRRGVADLREAVAQLRLQAAQRPGGAETQMLARLAAMGVQGANPDEWHGALEPSTGAPMWPAEQPVKVSPSKVEWAETCALRWALESAGGSREATEAQEVGTLLHELAEQFPAGGEPLLAAFEDRWLAVFQVDTWPRRVAHARARQKAERLAAYLGARASVEVLTERPFSLSLGDAVLVGKADRVELRPEGAYVVDIKTGEAIPSRAEAEQNAQLAMYQLAAASGAIEGAAGAAGAELAYVSSGKAGTSRVQAPVDVDAARQRLADVVGVMRSGTFEATVNPRCGSCVVRRSCPAHAQGRQVSDL